MKLDHIGDRRGYGETCRAT